MTDVSGRPPTITRTRANPVVVVYLAVRREGFHWVLENCRRCGKTHEWFAGDFDTNLLDALGDYPLRCSGSDFTEFGTAKTVTLSLSPGMLTTIASAMEAVKRIRGLSESSTPHPTPDPPAAVFEQLRKVMT